MSPRVLEALADLDSDGDEKVQDALVFLQEVIASNRTRGFTSYLPEARAEVLDAASLAALRAELTSWVERNRCHRNLGTAFWVLGKFYDRDLLPFFRDWLGRCVSGTAGDEHCLGQILVALDKLGEAAISGDGFGYNEHDKNLSDAKAYLAGIAGGANRGQWPQ